MWHECCIKNIPFNLYEEDITIPRFRGHCSDKPCALTKGVWLMTRRFEIKALSLNEWYTCILFSYDKHITIIVMQCVAIVV